MTLYITVGTPVAPSFNPSSDTINATDGSQITALQRQRATEQQRQPDADAHRIGTLPAGLIFDSGTGYLYGTPNTGDYTGSPYTYTVTADNGVGTATFTFHINVAKEPVNFPNNSAERGTVGRQRIHRQQPALHSQR